LPLYEDIANKNHGINIYMHASITTIIITNSMKRIKISDTNDWTTTSCVDATSIEYQHSTTSIVTSMSYMALTQAKITHRPFLISDAPTTT
jgi:hypothetical protein